MLCVHVSRTLNRLIVLLPQALNGRLDEVTRVCDASTWATITSCQVGRLANFGLVKFGERAFWNQEGVVRGLEFTI